MTWSRAIRGCRSPRPRARSLPTAPGGCRRYWRGGGGPPRDPRRSGGTRGGFLLPLTEGGPLEGTLLSQLVVTVAART